MRRSDDRRIFMMEITMHGNTVFILRRGPAPWPVSASQEICIRFPLCYVLLRLGTKISKDVIDKIFRIILPFFPLSHYFCHTLCGINKNSGFRVDCIKESPHGKTIIVCQVIRWMNVFRAPYKRNTVVAIVTTICPLTHRGRYKITAILQTTLSRAFENLWIFNNFSSKYVPYGLIDNMATLIEMMAWRWTT